MDAEIGKGIYTTKDISEILYLPTNKVNIWLKKYWQDSYWLTNGSRMTNFVGLIEFYVFYQLNERGFVPQKIKKVHQILKTILKVEHPFASELGLQTLGKEIFLQQNMSLISQKIEYSTDGIAQRFYPNGKESSVVVDPRIQFGSPTIKGTGVMIYTICMYYKGGEKIEFIAEMFDLKIKDINDAIKFKQVA